MAEIRDTILSRRQAAHDWLREIKYPQWDKFENLFHNELDDQISQKISSQVFDPKLSTLVLERSYRVMAQMPLGKIKAISKNDLGSAQLMELLVDKWINPNANAQFDLLTKFRMMDMYSNIYGNFFSLVDWDVKPNGYIGPDIWLLNIRDVFPQVGAVSLEDSDYIIIRTWKPLSYFESMKKGNHEGFKNIDQIVTKLKDSSGSKHAKPAEETSKREETQYPKSDPAKQKGYYEVLTMFERDRWVDFCVDADLEFRDIKNPHDNEELPVTCKYSIPLLDDMMGMGDFERGASMQQVINSNWNLYLDAVKMSIFPPVILNKDNIASTSSIQYSPAAKWLARGNVDNVARAIQLNPQGISTFNNTYQVASSALLNLFGTTDTAVAQQTEAGFGKTPKALAMQQQRENTRDNADRFFMEQYLKQTYKKMVNLLSKKQSSAVTIRMFQEEIDELARNYPDIADMYDQKTGKLTIESKRTGSILYDWEVVSGSTFATDQKTQQENLASMLTLLTGPAGQQILQMVSQEGYEVKFGELFKKIVSNSGVQDWDKIFVQKTPQEQGDAIMAQHAQQLQQAMQQMQAGNMNQVPPQPQGGMPPDMSQQMPQQGMPQSPMGGM